MISKLLLPTVLLLAVAMLLGGCAQQQPPAPQPAMHDSPITGLLYYSRALLQADSSARMVMLGAAKNAYNVQQTPTTAAQLALAYGQPGYKGYAPENGWRYAHKALTLAPADFWGAQATTYLQQFAQLCTDNDTIRNQLDTAQQRQQQLDIELAQLRQQLATANAKLQALTHIESKLNP